MFSQTFIDIGVSDSFDVIINRQPITRGFELKDMDNLIEILKIGKSKDGTFAFSPSLLKVKSVFSHLAGSDDHYIHLQSPLPFPKYPVRQAALRTAVWVLASTILPFMTSSTSSPKGTVSTFRNSSSSRSRGP